MPVPDDITTTPTPAPTPDEQRHGGRSAERGLVWLEGGEERPFEDADASPRPWLEVSAEWNAPSDGLSTPGASGDDGDDLVWL